MSLRLYFSVVLLLSITHSGECALKLANYFHDHMVLQRGPQQAVVWGTSASDHVTATLTDGSDQGQSVTAPVQGGKFKFKLPAQTSKRAFTLTVRSPNEGHVVVHDVLFGDVWLCSGQSNMYFQLHQAFNGSLELEDAKNYPNIRFTRVERTFSGAPRQETNYDVPWTTPSDSQSLSTFSAVCWLYAKDLYSHLNYPIGLVESSWGGTPIEAWSGPSAITACSNHRSTRNQHSPSQLYNNMINPLLSATIYGALWYQGEANSGHADRYACQIENMVKQWRHAFHQQSLQQTSLNFPFGYAQISDVSKTSIVGGFPFERWGQTANYGYSPNPALPNTFMAVTMDLPDYNSPYGAIHPRFKQDVAERLLLGGLHVAYKQRHVEFQGPFPSAIVNHANTLTVQYDNNTANLVVKNSNGFDICCSFTNTTNCDLAKDNWRAAPITSHSHSTVTLDITSCSSHHGHTVGLRYEWRQSPCEYKQCALYGPPPNSLPAPPYITLSLTPSAQPVLIG